MASESGLTEELCLKPQGSRHWRGPESTAWELGQAPGHLLAGPGGVLGLSSPGQPTASVHPGFGLMDHPLLGVPEKWPALAARTGHCRPEEPKVTWLTDLHSLPCCSANSGAGP